MYSPYDFKTTEEREGRKFKGTIVFTGIDEGIRGTYKTLGGEMGSYVRSHSCPAYNGVHIWLPGSDKKRDHDPITITDEPTFRRVVSALNAVRDKLIAEHEAKEIEAKEGVCWPDGQPLKTYNEEDDMESITVIDGVKKEKVYDFKATSFTENGKWVKGEVQFTWMNEKYRSKPNSSVIDIGIHNNRIVRSSFSPCVGFSSLFIPGESVSSDGNVLRYANKNDFDRDVAALTACQYKPVVEDRPKMLDATLKAIDVYVVEREKEVKRINGVIEQLAGLKEKRPKDICDQFMKVKGRDFYKTVVGFPHETSTCPYCIDGHSGGLYCRNDSCGYAKAHGGICDADERSDWHKMRSARKTLLCAIEKAYPFEDKD